MKPRLFIVLSLLIAGMTHGFAQVSKELKTEDDGYKWYLTSSNGALGAQDSNGKEIVPLSKKYDWVSYDHGLFCGTLFDPDGDYKKNKNGYYDKSGRELISPAKYEGAYFNESKDGMPAWFTVRKNGLEGACDITGKEVVAPIYNGLLYGSEGFEGKKNAGGSFEPLNVFLTGHDIMAFVKKKQMTESDGFVWYKLEYYPNYGAADKDGNVLLPMERKFTSVKYKASTTQGKQGYFEVRKDDYVGVYGVNGIEILSPDKKYTYWSYSGDSERGYLRVDRNDAKYGFCDLNQNEIIAPGKYSYASYNSKGYFAVEQGDYEGVCDLNGKEIIAPNKYTSILLINLAGSPQWFAVERNDLEGACDMAGNELVPPRYSDLYYDNAKGFYYEDSNGNDIALNVRITSASSNGNTDYIKELFDQAYNTPDEETQTKYDLYMKVVEADAGNKEGYQLSAYNNIGALYENIGDLKNARAYYEKCLQIQPSYELARTNLKRVKSQQSTEKLNNLANVLGQAANMLGAGSTQSSGGSYNNSYQNSYSSSSGTQTRTKVTRNCTRCAGTGECRNCMGRGRILGKIDQEWRPCPSCNPGGNASKEKKGKCTFCKGTGKK